MAKDINKFHIKGWLLMSWLNLEHNWNLMKHYVSRTIKCFNEEIRFEFLFKNSRFRARSDLMGQFVPYFRCTVLDGSLSTLQVGNWRNINLEIVVIGFEGLIWLTDWLGENLVWGELSSFQDSVKWISILSTEPYWQIEDRPCVVKSHTLPEVTLLDRQVNEDPTAEYYWTRRI